MNKINFGNNIGYTIDNYINKKNIINYLFENIDIYKLNNYIIKNNDDLLFIHNNNYYLVENIYGDDYIFITKKIKDIYYVVLIEKKTINFEHLNYNDLNIISIKIRLKLECYNGCIFDGRIVNLGGCYSFIINKVYKLYGENMVNIKIDDIFKKCEQFINDSYIIDSHMNIINFKLCKLHDINNFKILYEKKKNISSFDFINENYQKTYRYYLNNIDNDLKNVIIYGKLINTDVVEYYSYDKNNILQRIGISHIPNLKISKLVNENLNDNLRKIGCKLDYRFKKFVPIIIYNDDDDIKITKFEEVLDKIVF